MAEGLSMQGSASSSNADAGVAPEVLLSNYIRYLPGIMNLNQGQLSQLISQLAQSGEQAVGGAGGRTVESLLALADKASPSSRLAEQANVRSMGAAETAASGADELLAAGRAGLKNVDLSGLSPGEYNATERALNQDNVKTGNMGLLNPMNIVKNAMNFGGAFNAKNNLFQNAISGLKSGVDAVSGIPGMFSNTAKTAADTAASKAGTASLFGGIANPSAMGAGLFANQTDLMGKMSAGTQSSSRSGSASGGIGCCFIFMEAYHGTMPASVRIFRDKYYRLKPEIADGYKKMAHWLVPMMQKYSIIRNLVWNLMISPATKHCENSRHGLNKRISHFWLRFWAVYGKL